MHRLLDLVFAVLLEPRVRRVRRWSFLVTLPVAAVVIATFGLGTTLGIALIRLALWAGALLIAVADVAGVQVRRERVGRDLLVIREETALLAANGKVDVWLDLREPVRLERAALLPGDLVVEGLAQAG